MRELKEIELKVTKSKYLPECVINFLCWIFPSTLELRVGKNTTVWRTGWFDAKINEEKIKRLIEK